MTESSGEDAARPATPRSGGEVTGAATILIVEDNAATRGMMSLTLTRAGYDVVEAGDGETALRIVAEREPAMVLLDCKLPDMDGFELGRRLQTLVPSLPIVAITGWAHLEQARVLTAGFLEVLLKPVLPSRLVELVDRYTRRSVDPPSPGARLLILADDDAMQRKLGIIALTHAGFEVLVAEDGEEAMRLVAQRKPDIVVSDVLMPRMDGFGVCKAMRANPALSDVPIVLMSAHYLEAEDRKLAARFGANRYVSRTSGFGAVVVAVLEALASPAVEPVAPPTEDLQANYVRRITHQLERQASLGAGLARQVSAQATALSVLDNLSRSLSRELDPESVLGEMLAVCLDAAGLSAGAILLRDAKGELKVKANLGVATGIVWDAHAAVLHDAMVEGGLLIPAAGTAAAGPELLAALGVTSALVVPIVARGDTLGVLLLASSHTDLADAEDVTLVASKAPALGRVRIDLSSLEQAIMNLVVNARDAMPTGGKLTLETANVTLDETYAYAHPGVTAGPHVMLAVTDTGMGMDTATQSRIFEPFFTTKPKEKGTGLGLSTVFGIVQQGGGSVWVYSELGKGTTFKVYLPRVDANVERMTSQPAAATLRGTETILLVEDDDPVRAAATGILRQHGYHVIAARHSGEALLLSEQCTGAIHLLMTDVVMPLLGGPDLARRLAKDRPKMKVICMSGYTDETIVRHGFVEASMAYLQKPFTTDTLARKTREVLDA